ncbi:phage head closure protein [Psychrobacter sp. Marseille-P5312]|uniref:phage head closure protein n=1 Tax=Psychrobacter sp. Marseille-P5312 TaxID=2086574 RepID=UPI000CF6548D|nr:phage head closure protein [Psychrobacter sp. Marseille-P5312]
MAIKAGELRHRVTVQSFVSGGRDDDGFDLPSEWIDYKKIWAKITPLSTKDLLSAQSADSEITARMKVRYRTGLDVDTTMRVIWKGRVFAIDSQGLDDSDTGVEYTTFNLGGGVEQFKG